MTSAAAGLDSSDSGARDLMSAVPVDDPGGKPPSEAGPSQPPREVEAGVFEELDRLLERGPAPIAEARREVARLRRVELALREKLLRMDPAAEEEPRLWYKAEDTTRRRREAEERVERLEAALLAARVSETSEGGGGFGPVHVSMLILLLGLLGLSLFVVVKL